MVEIIRKAKPPPDLAISYVALHPRPDAETVAIIASGPSLSPDQVDYVQGKAFVIAINDNWEIAPWADMLYACDAKWWDWHPQAATEFQGWKLTQDEETALRLGIDCIECNKEAEGLSDNPRMIHGGLNSGYQALNIAYLLGARKIVLLGYDMKISRNGSAHWFGDHPDKVRSTYESFIEKFPSTLPQLRRAGCEVFNCSTDTALDAFPVKPLETVL